MKGHAFSLLVFGAIISGSNALSQTLPAFDFTQPEIAREWRNPHDISNLRPTADGLEISISGDDPYFLGPPRDYPEGMLLWMNVRLNSDEAGSAQVFYFRSGPDEEKSVRFTVPAGEWTDVRVPLPALGANHRLRIDPPGRSGKMLLASVRFEKRVKLPAPAWPEWVAPSPATTRRLAAGDVELFSGAAPLALEVRVRGQSMAFTHPRPRIAYVRDDEVRWVDLAAGAISQEQIAKDSLAVVSRTKDADGAEWVYQQTFRADSSGVIATETSVMASEERRVVYLPMHMLMAGERSFGAKKGQGLLGGLEYLEDEPSSSEADIIGPESNRRVPSSHKITMPLMAVQANERYVGLIWEAPLKFAALFDSPDRTFGSGGHVMGVLFPGSDGTNREEGSLLPYYGEVMKANVPLVSRAWIVGGSGRSIVPAVQQYVKLRGWPELPRTGLSLADYVTLASDGWLNSRIRETNLYRHAFWPGFNPQPAADAAVYEMWLATQTSDAAQSNALHAAARGALSVLKPQNYYHSAVSHVRAPVAPLVFGGVREAVEAARQTARAQLGRFSADGSIPYRTSKGTDYGKTHFARDANGLTAQVVATLLEAASFCGDRDLIREGIAKLRALDKFRDTVPRGAQTWEVPLHTPDILASAHLVRAYALGHELTGERDFLEQATYWAWTGVPFVYLVNPTPHTVGPYSTIAVLGATSWKAPVWFGRPVQWCGLVYADSLYRLAALDQAGPWKKLADGITSAGLQHTWRGDDRQRVGLLPDFYELKAQTRAGPAINPGTVGSNATQLYGRGSLYDFRALRRAELLVHAPGEISVESDASRRATFTVRGWPVEPYFVLVNGIPEGANVKVAGASTEAFDARHGQLVLKLESRSRVQLEW